MTEDGARDEYRHDWATRLGAAVKTAGGAVVADPALAGVEVAGLRPDPDWGDSDVPERALWLAVIERAAMDARGCLPAEEEKAEEEKAETEARAFLSDVGGEWAESREVVCDLAGIDPDWLRGQALLRRLLPG